MKKISGLKIAIVFMAIALVFMFVTVIMLTLAMRPINKYNEMKLFSSIDEVDNFIQSQNYKILEEIEFSETVSVGEYYGRIISISDCKVKVNAYKFTDAENSKTFCKKYVKQYSNSRPYGIYEVVGFSLLESTKLLWYDEGSLIILETVNKFDHDVLNELFYKMQMVFSRNMITE